MRPWRMHLNVKKSARTNADYIEILKLVVKETDEQSQSKENNDNEL